MEWKKYPGRYLGGGPLVHSAGGISGGLCLLAEPDGGHCLCGGVAAAGSVAAAGGAAHLAGADDPRELEVSVGVLFPVLHRMPRLTVCGLQRVTTPVLRRAGLCLAWVHGPAGRPACCRCCPPKIWTPCAGRWGCDGGCAGFTRLIPCS